VSLKGISINSLARLPYPPSVNLKSNVETSLPSSTYFPNKLTIAINPIISNIMDLLSRVRTGYLSWSQETPLPLDVPDATPTFQSWHAFDAGTQEWKHVDDTQATQTSQSIRKNADPGSKIELVTWNVDAFAPVPESRMSAIISNIFEVAPKVDIISLQEVSRAGLTFLLRDSRIRDGWFSSEADDNSWRGQSFASMTLLSKSRFAYTKDKESIPSGKMALGPVWRVNYPSKFGRDALCCDVFVESSRVRLINVHLDSLPIQPSKRPRQIQIIASLLRSANRGLVAGDFNPVLPEDDTLIQKNHLVDAWAALQPDESGFTWGVDGKQPFPPNRMDKVAMLGLKAESIEVMHPGSVTNSKVQVKLSAGEKSSSKNRHDDSDELVPWSDHSGLKCSFRLP
jgi:tyrosyl-DNA phosphodiesterase 2